MENSKEIHQKKVIGFLTVVCLVFAFSSAFFAFSMNRYRSRERLINEKAISSLCESLDSISVSLCKTVYSADKTALLRAGNELCRQAAAAKESLSLLSADREISDEIYRFLSQVGNYTLSIAQGEADISASQAQSLKELYSYALKLSDGMNEICYDYYNGDVDFGDAVGNLEKEAGSPGSDFYQRVYDTAQTLTDYPTLVYDGPFADNVVDAESDFLAAEEEITTEEAARIIEEIFGVQTGTLKKEEDINSDIGLYCFSVGKADITVTKKGGYICSVLTDAYAYEETISTGEAVKRGNEYLVKLGYEGLKSSYYSTYDGICTVNYVYEDEGIKCYSDLIKVSISLDTGKLVAFDARSFLLSHRQREKGDKLIGAKNAAGKISSGLTITDSGLAFIPLDSGKEALCYEFHCKDSEGQEVLIYLDAYTGEQKDILILLYSDGGVLTK